MIHHFTIISSTIGCVPDRYLHRTQSTCSPLFPFLIKASFPYTLYAESISIENGNRHGCFLISSKFSVYFLSIMSSITIQFPSFFSAFDYLPSVKIKNNLYRQNLYPKHTRTYHNMCNPNQRSMHDGKFVWQNYKSYKP